MVSTCEAGGAPDVDATRPEGPGPSGAEATCVEEPAGGLPHIAEVRPRAVLHKALLLLALSAVVVGLYHATPLSDWLRADGALARHVGELGLLGPLALGAVMVAAIPFGVPRLLFCPIAGALFGFWTGLVLCIAGPLAGYYAVFLFVRGRREGSPPRMLLHPRLSFLGRDPGFGGVVIARLIPLPGMVINVALALSAVRHRAYLGGSALGMVPEAAPLVLLGAGLLAGDPVQVARLSMVALVCLLAAGLAIQQVARRRARAVQLDEAQGWSGSASTATSAAPSSSVDT